MILYRPVGKKELDLIENSDWRKFPPRLPSQPIFYPVLTLEYARKIAKDWNTQDINSGYQGHVVQFEIDQFVKDKYPIQTAGGKHHLELWVPAENLEEFNEHIVGSICLIESYYDI